jgi:hypothetical protein
MYNGIILGENPYGTGNKLLAIPGKHFLKHLMCKRRRGHRETYPVAVCALDESGGGQEPVAMFGVGVKLKQHVASAAATGHARGLGR